MHWTPLSGARFDDVFGPQGKSTRARTRRRHDPRRDKAKPRIESLENRVTPALTAGVIATSLGSTQGTNVTIGEVVRMRIVVDRDISGAYDPTGYNVWTNLSPGLQLMPDSVRMALVSDQGILSSLDPNGTGGLNKVGGDGTATPTFLLPSSAITMDPATGAVFFHTGITNAPENDPNNEFVIIEFNALVTNVAGNQAETPTQLNGQFQLFIENQPCDDCVAGQSVTVVEPAINDVTKTAQVNTAGDSATYTVTFSNTGNSIAYDVRLVDNLPTGLTLDVNSVTVTGGGSFADRSNGTSVDLTFDSVAVGGRVTVTYTAAIAPSARGQTIVNTADVDYTSLPGTNGASPNPTGSVTPGGSGTTDGERDGSGGVNDYFDTAQASITVAGLPNSLSGFVYVDRNHSGDFDAGDSFVQGAVITLLDANGNPVTDVNGNVVAPITTAADGRFSFTGLPDGTYQVIENYDEVANGLIDGLDNPGLINGVLDTTAQVDPSPPGDRIFNIQLSGGDVGVNYRFGECEPASISGHVYFDLNCDGILNNGDTPLPGVVVQLFDAAGNPVLDASGNPITDVTDANGLYEFTGLLPGTYQVHEVQPANPALIDGADVLGTVNGTVRGTVVANDTFQVTLGLGDVGVNFDFFECPVTPQPSSISGFTYEDFTRPDPPTDNDGIFQQGIERPIPGVTLTLTDINGNPVTDLNGNIVGPTVSDANGFYIFTNLAAGTYRVTETQPAGYVDGADTPGSVGGNSGPNGGRGGPDFITNIVLPAGVNAVHYDFGELPNIATVNGFVFFDVNCDGIKQVTDNGIAGVRVQLTDMNGNPVTDFDGNVVGIATTDATGFFQFLNLNPGIYRVTELPPQPIVNGQMTIDGLDTAGTVNGVTRGTAANDVINGIALAGGENSINNLFAECPPGNVGAISISGHVYFDRNNDCVFNGTDSPIPGATVHLFRTDLPGGPTEVAQQQTNDRGEYLFQVEFAGTYMVVEDQPAGFLDGCDMAGTVNGQPRGTTGNDVLSNIALVNGDVGINYDFGEITAVPPPPPFSKQQLLASAAPGGGTPIPGVGGTQAFATDPSFANINRAADATHRMATGTDAGGGPHVRVFNFTTGQTLFSFFAYDPSFAGGVRVAMGDVTGDGVPDIITAPGAGGGPHIKVFNGATGALVKEFFAYDPSFRGGVYVAAGDVNGDGIADIITGAGEGGGPHVKVFDGATGAVIREFFAYDKSFFGGVRVAAGDFDMDGRADIVTGAGPGGGPHVRVFSGATGAVLNEFFAFDPSFRGGVYVTSNANGGGDVTGDGRTDLVVGTGAGAGIVKVIDGASFATFSQYVAFDATATSGVRVGLFDLNGDGRGDVIAATGGGIGAFVRITNIATGQDLDFWQAYNPAYLGGTFVSAS